MFELISQIPFHFTTSLCSLMDPIYYIYHKLYHIFGDHVGHCHQARLCARSGAGRRAQHVHLSKCTFSVIYCESKSSECTCEGPVASPASSWPNKSTAAAFYTDDTFVHVNCTRTFRKLPHVEDVLYSTLR